MDSELMRWADSMFIRIRMVLSPRLRMVEWETTNEVKGRGRRDGGDLISRFETALT